MPSDRAASPVVAVEGAQKTLLIAARHNGGVLLSLWGDDQPQGGVVFSYVGPNHVSVAEDLRDVLRRHGLAFTAALEEAGFHVVGFDLEPQPEYPAEACFMQVDARDVDARAFRGAAVAVLSPPCQGFSQAVIRREVAAKRPRLEDFDLLFHALRVVREAEPRFWVVENVQGAAAWWRGILGPEVLRSPPYFLWGHFPGFILPKTGRLKIKHGSLEPKWRNAKRLYVNAAHRSEIPAALASPLARACRDALEVVA